MLLCGGICLAAAIAAVVVAVLGANSNPYAKALEKSYNKKDASIMAQHFLPEEQEDVRQNLEITYAFMVMEETETAVQYHYKVLSEVGDTGDIKTPAMKLYREDAQGHLELLERFQWEIVRVDGKDYLTW